MTYRHISASMRLARDVGGPVGQALERATEASARDAAARALTLAAAALAADELAEALHILTEAGFEAQQAVEVGWWWALPQRSKRDVA